MSSFLYSFKEIQQPNGWAYTWLILFFLYVNTISIKFVAYIYDAIAYVHFSAILRKIKV